MAWNATIQNHPPKRTPLMKKADIEVINVHVPGPLGRKVKTLLLDPHTGRIEYGAMTRLITGLLNEWVKTQIGEHERMEDGSGSEPQHPQG